MTPDAFWRHAMRSAYLNSIERAGLRDVAVRYALRPLADRDSAAVPELRDDGAALLVKLTVDRVEAYALDYSERGWSESFSFPSDE